MYEMYKPYRPTLPPRAGYVERDGEYVKAPLPLNADVAELNEMIQKFVELM